jgi:hypothetical protein
MQGEGLLFCVCAWLAFWGGGVVGWGFWAMGLGVRVRVKVRVRVRARARVTACLRVIVQVLA